MKQFEKCPLKHPQLADKQVSQEYRLSAKRKPAKREEAHEVIGECLRHESAANHIVLWIEPTAKC
jgi:hypothetical protein